MEYITDILFKKQNNIMENNIFELYQKTVEKRITLSKKLTIMIENIETKHILDALVEQHGEIDGKTIFDNLEKSYYEPSESMEFYDPINDQYYNISGQELTNPEVYNENEEGYTPFGDE